MTESSTSRPKAFSEMSEANEGDIRLHRCRECMLARERERERERALAWAFSIGDSMLAKCIALASSNNIGLEGRLPLGTRG